MRFTGVSKKIRSYVGVTGAAALSVVALAACTPDPNPGWPAAGCVANIAILVDRSASVGDPSVGGNQTNVNNYKASVKNMVGQLTDTNARVFIGAFATNADYTVYSLYQAGGGYADVPTATNPFTGGSIAKAQSAIDAIPFGGTASDPNYSTYTAPSGVGRGRTNWQAAINMAPAGANLIIIVTDGDPTWRTGADPAANGGGVDQEDIDYAIGASNDRKKQNTRVVAVHFGDKNGGGPYGGWEQRIQGITQYSLNSDYWSTSYAGLTSSLQQITSAGCRPATTTTTAPPATTTTTRAPVIPT